MLDRPLGAFSEAVRSLRTSIQYLGVDTPVKVILVTNAASGAGRTCISANLAAVFAQAGLRTVSIGADLRRTGLAEMFPGTGDSLGLAGLVAGVAKNGEVVCTNGSTNGVPATFLVKTKCPNLLLLPSGPTPPNPAELLAGCGEMPGTRNPAGFRGSLNSLEACFVAPAAFYRATHVRFTKSDRFRDSLLGSRRTRELLGRLTESADIVVVDAPPLLPVTDAAVLAPMVDGVVLVAAINESRREAVRRAKEIVAATGARLLGVVANKAPSGAGGYGYGYGYGYGSPEGEDGEKQSRFRGRPWSRSSRQASIPSDTGQADDEVDSVAV